VVRPDVGSVAEDYLWWAIGVGMNIRNLIAALPRVLYKLIKFAGGVDQTTPQWERLPGRPRAALNFECDIRGGYRRIKGYERFDGQTSPSAGQYSIISCTFSGVVAVGNTVTGLTSHATMYVIAVTAGAIIGTKIAVGTFASGEALQVGGVTKATATSEALANSASTSYLQAYYTNLAADVYRADIAAVPGTGTVLGVVRYGGVTYAVRNDAAGTAAAIYKSSASGWTLVVLNEQISFTLGSGDVDEGDILTQGGVTATILRVVITTGTLALGTAAGKLIISGRAGGNYAAGAATTTGAGALTLSAAQAAITLLPGGTYEFVVSNFGGAVATKRVYGSDGVNKGFEFDGTVYVPIDTGMVLDAPKHVCEHKKHLFFSFGASVQHSGPGTPYVWSAVLGAAELGMGDNVTAFKKQPGSTTGGALMIFTRNLTSILYGNSSADWVLSPYRDELGAYAYTVDQVGRYTLILDDRGVTTLQTVQEYGNFSYAAISNCLQTWINQQRLKATTACICRDKSQYRLYFSDGTALYITFGEGNKLIGMMPIELTDEVRCIFSSEESDGSETIFSGSDDGFVYQHEKGTSFDGDDIDFYIMLPYWNLGMPRYEKGFFKAIFEVSGDGYFTFNFSYELDYATTDQPQPGTTNLTLSFSPVFWDSFTWDNFVWDGKSLSSSEDNMGGDAENVSLIIQGASDYMIDALFSGAIVYYIPRALLH